MKKFAVLSIFLLIFSQSVLAITLRTQTEKLSYAIGNEMGISFRQHQTKLNPALVMQGLQDGLAGRRPKLSRAQKQQVMLVYQHQMMAKIHKKVTKQAKVDAVKSKTFLAANAKKPGIKTTSSGLQYKVLAQGNGPKPKASDVVKVDYTGMLINGSVFDSSKKHGGKPVTFPVNQVIKGWTEALQMMPVGSTWMLYIPANLAYGSQGMPMAGIGPDAALIFKVHLVGIQHSK